jgi:hypothetical protein
VLGIKPYYPEKSQKHDKNTGYQGEHTKDILSIKKAPEGASRKKVEGQPL